MLTADERALLARIGRAAQARRARTPRACLLCGRVRLAYNTLRYCSNACRQRAKYARARARAAAG